MKYIEELVYGDAFLYKEEIYLLGIDFKSDGKRLCISLKDGRPNWLNGDTIVEETQIYTLDKQNTIIPIKKTLKKDENSNIS